MKTKYIFHYYYFLNCLVHIAIYYTCIFSVNYTFDFMFEKYTKNLLWYKQFPKVCRKSEKYNIKDVYNLSEIDDDITIRINTKILIHTIKKIKFFNENT